MNILEAIGHYLEAQGHGTLGVNLFLGRMQETNVMAVAIYEYEGQSPIEMMGAGVAPIDLPRIQVAVRGIPEAYPEARAKVEAIRDVLQQISEQELSGVSIMRVRALGSILPLGFDSQDRPTLSANFECVVRR
jgi:hypothetical protein